jgi:hypothetical protein
MAQGAPLHPARSIYAMEHDYVLRPRKRFACPSRSIQASVDRYIGANSVARRRSAFESP